MTQEFPKEHYLATDEAPAEYPKEIIRGAWRINYGEHFDAIRENHPNIISTIEGMVDNINLQNGTDYKHRTIVDNDISLTLLNEKESKRHYSLQLPEGNFFLKEVFLDNNQIAEGGFEEFENARVAKELLKEIPGVAVVEYAFGFSNAQKNYVVTKWNHTAEKLLIRTLEEISEDPNDGNNSHLYRNITARVEKIKSALIDFRDVTPLNMAYESTTDTIIVFDINKGSSILADSPDDEL